MAVFTGNGSQSAPSFTFSSDTNTGFYHPAADTVGLSIGGTDAFFVNSTRQALFGATNTAVSTRLGTTTISPVVQVREGGQGSMLFWNIAAGANPPTLYTVKSRGNPYGNIVQANDAILRLSGAGDDGVQATEGARIDFEVDGTPGANTMPGRIRFFTNPGGGTTTVAEVARITSDKYLRMASGTGGIQFNGDTAAANALDDYEQGAFTANYSTTGTPLSSVSYNSSGGYYVKVGRLVHCWFDVRTSNVTFGSATGNLTITGIPFIPAYTAAQDAIGFGLCGNFTGVTSRMGIVVFYNTLVANVVTETVGNAATAFAPVAASALTTGAFVNQNHIEVQFSYITD